MRGEGEGAKHRAGADIRRRLLAADMLLARRKREHEAALALGVDRLTRETPRHLAHMLLAAGEQPDIGSAELKPDADALPLPHDDVGSHLAGRLDQTQRD